MAPTAPVGDLAEALERAAKATEHPEPRILVLDIETRPALAYVWGTYDQNLGLEQIVEPAAVICWAAKWMGQRKVRFASDHHDGHQAMLEGIWRLLDEADLVVTFNGISFDDKWLMGEFLRAGMQRPSHFRDIDLLRHVKRQARFTSHKLDHVATVLGLGEKVRHTGFRLWRECLEGDEKAWTLMRRYNRHDVELTEQVYLALRPFIKNHPHLGAINGHTRSCPSCGSTQLEEIDPVHTNVGSYRGFRCTDCGSLSKGSRRETEATVTRGL